MNGPLAIATFGPIYEELVNALMRKAMYSLQENEWTADQREAFRCYRTDIADTIMYCYVSILYTMYQYVTQMGSDPLLLFLTILHCHEIFFL